MCIWHNTDHSSQWNYRISEGFEFLHHQRPESTHMHQHSWENTVKFLRSTYCSLPWTRHKQFKHTFTAPSTGATGVLSSSLHCFLWSAEVLCLRILFVTLHYHADKGQTSPWEHKSCHFYVKHRPKSRFYRWGKKWWFLIQTAQSKESLNLGVRLNFPVHILILIQQDRILSFNQFNNN